MAKATAICTCKTCGAKFKMEKKFFKRADANSWERWAEDYYDQCADCYREERDRKKEEEAQKAIEAGAVKRRVPYGAYKASYPGCQTIPDTYDEDDRSIEIIVEVVDGAECRQRSKESYESLFEEIIVRLCTRLGKQGISSDMLYVKLRAVIMGDYDKRLGQFIRYMEESDDNRCCPTHDVWKQAVEIIDGSEEIQGLVKQEALDYVRQQVTQREDEKAEAARIAAIPRRAVRISYAEYKKQYPTYKTVKDSYDSKTKTIEIIMREDEEYVSDYKTVEMTYADAVVQFGYRRQKDMEGDDLVSVRIRADAIYTPGKWHTVVMPYKDYKKDYDKYVSDSYDQRYRTIRVWLPEDVTYQRAARDEHYEERAAFRGGYVDEITITPDTINPDELKVEVPECLKNALTA